MNLNSKPHGAPTPGSSDFSQLSEAAWKARERAHSPYSKFAVGAALRCSNDEIFCGCNVENLSFGLTMCAERVAVGAAVAAGKTDFEEIVIVADTEEPISPCGACRQVLAEFAPHMKITSQTKNGASASWTLDELLPRPATGILNRP